MTSVDSRPEPEPDHLCIHVDGPVAFELVSLTDSAIAKMQAAGQKAHKTPSTRQIQRGNHPQKTHKEIHDECRAHRVAYLHEPSDYYANGRGGSLIPRARTCTFSGDELPKHHYD